MDHKTSLLHLFVFSNIVISTNSLYSHNSRHLIPTQPFALTNTFFHFSSFLLDTSRHCNNLPKPIVSSTSYDFFKKMPEFTY